MLTRFQNPPLPINPIVNPTGFSARARSKTATRVPGAARSIASAAERPAGPPPTMQTSTSVSAIAFRVVVALPTLRLLFLRAGGEQREVIVCATRGRPEGETRGRELCMAFFLF